MQGKVEISGVNTAKLKTLKNDEMVRLMKLAKSGDEEARQALIEGNLRLVLSVIQRFVGRGENPDDLFQVGCIGLLKAIANFDETKEVSRAMDAIAAPISLYDPVYSDGGDPLTVMDQVRDTKNTDERWIERIALRDAFQTLSEREKQILILRFYDGKTQMEVAGQVGISQAQVSRLEKSAIGTIRKNVMET